MPAALVIGARNLGRSVIQRLVADGWDVTGGARSQGTLEKIRATGVRALTQAAALELREHGIQVTLLVIDAVIDREGDEDDRSTADPATLADAVAYLASQSPRAMTHELQLTPALDQWVP